MSKRYEEKRDFQKTPEPSGVEESTEAGPLRFVIQKHDARRLHYDLRLEWDGVLVSWAVPKGPSVNPKDKHLAVHVEDHPLSYGSFEGQIPKGQYGGGEVIVWDEGTYSPDEDGVYSWDNREEAQRRMREGLQRGKLSFTLNGSKLKGSWTLVKIQKSEKDWLFIKHKDEYVSETRDVLSEDRSVLSGRTVEDVAAGRQGVVEVDLDHVPGAIRQALPNKLVPMGANEVEEPFNDPNWIFEVKLDGVRAIAIVENHRPKLYSRNGIDITDKFPSLVKELAAFSHSSFILDGEVVRYNDQGVPNFQSLMERYQCSNPRDIERFDRIAPIEFCIFDLLYLDGWDLRQATLSERRKILETAGFHGSLTRVLDAYPEDGKLVYEQVKGFGFEGVIAKRLDSKYRDGTRSTQWLKIKGYHSEDFIVAGYTEGIGMRGSTFGSLLLGAYEDGKLVYQGNVGGGFSDKQLEEIKSQLVETKENPFGVKIDIANKIHWVEPKVWVEVQYANRTRDGKLRFPIFKRLRLDVMVANKDKAKEESNEVSSVLDQLKGPKKDLVVEVEGQKIHYSSLDKVLWPAYEEHPAVTKRDLAMYYAQVAPYILPHLKDRPLSFVRCPDGIAGEHFFQKHWEKGLPDFVEEVEIWSSSNNRSSKYLMCNNLPTLLWMAQIGIIEIHPWYSRYSTDADRKDLPNDTSSNEEALDASVLNYPDFMVVDLDPNIRSGKEKDGHEPELNQEAFKMVIEAAFGLKEMLDDLKLTGYLKTSGKTGIHVYIPIIREFPYEVVRQLCETMGRHLMQQMPNVITMEWSVKKRPEKVFYDHNQNVRGKTLVSIFSPRIASGAPVSFPIQWSELAETYPMDYTLTTVPSILEKKGDYWKDILLHKHTLKW